MLSFGACDDEPRIGNMYLDGAIDNRGQNTLSRENLKLFDFHGSWQINKINHSYNRVLPRQQRESTFQSPPEAQQRWRSHSTNKPRSSQGEWETRRANSLICWQWKLHCGARRRFRSSPRVGHAEPVCQGQHTDHNFNLHTGCSISSSRPVFAKHCMAVALNRSPTVANLCKYTSFFLIEF